MNNIETYWRIWKRAHLVSMSQCIVNESTLKCVLYKEFMHEIPNVYMVADPYCNGEHPDIAIANNSIIVDIFELKYDPSGYAKFVDDIMRLAPYVAERAGRTMFISMQSRDIWESYTPHISLLSAVIASCISLQHLTQDCYLGK